MFKFLKGIFSKSSDSVLGIDVGTSSIKVVQLKMEGGKAVLETYGSLAMGPYGESEVGQAVKLPTDKIVEALSDILREASVSTRNCGFAIPFKSSLMSVIEMPTNNEKQLEEMVPIEARKYIPVPISEVSLDWMIIPRNDLGREKNERTEVLLVAIHNEILDTYHDIVQRASLEATFFEIEIFSTIRAILEENTEPVMIFDMGSSSTKLYLVERGVVRSSHTVNRGSQDITRAIASAFSLDFEEAEQMKRGHGITGKDTDEKMADVVSVSLDYIFADANRVIENFQKKYDQEVTKIHLVGGGVTLHGFKEFAQQNLNTPVELGNAFEKVETPAFLEDVLKETGPEFAVAVGVALRKLQEGA